MTRYIKFCSALVALMLIVFSCDKQDYKMGDLASPTDVVINTAIVGQDATHPDGDGSGDVIIELTGKNVLSYKIDYNATDGISLDFLPTGKVTRKYTSIGTNTYRITVVAYGPGATATTVTKDIQVRSDFTPDPSLVAKLTGTGSKAWRVNKDIPAHFGVGPWEATSVTPVWWAAGVNEKVGCCNCFYTATFIFTKNAASGTFSIESKTPDGAFTKNGALAGGLPGIPAGAGDEACYPYAGGNSSFMFAPSGSGVDAATPSTKTAIVLGGNTTFIGYGSLQKEYEILSITDTELYLRAQGTEVGNAWYLKLKAD